MVTVLPFRALRFTEKAGMPEKLCCPPYDIISDDERAALIERDEHNVIRLELPKGENRYDEAGKLLTEWRENGILACDEKPGMYVYEESFEVAGKQYAFAGIIARVKTEEFSKGNILPHEETLSKAKQDRFDLMNATMANFSQIYSLYADEEKKISPIVERTRTAAPEKDFVDDKNVRHRLWKIEDEGVLASITAGFADKKLYIADGHHRYETSINFRNYLRESGKNVQGADYVMMMLVDMDSDGLVIFPTHRLVRDIADFDADKFLKKAEKRFKITEISLNSVATELEKCENSVAFLSKDRAAIMTLRDLADLAEAMPDASEAYRSLDVCLLHQLILEPYFGIDKENMAQQKNLTYTRSAVEALQSVLDGGFQCAFLLNATRVRQIKDVSAAGEKMPQKSTYFYPKLITGLVMNSLID